MGNIITSELRSFIRAVIQERFRKTGDVDALGRQRLTYDADLADIIGSPTGKDVSRKGGQAVGFPVFSAFVTRPASDVSPEYVEDVLEAIKGKSSTYFISDEDRMRLVAEGAPTVASYILTFLSGRYPGYEDIQSRVFSILRSQNLRNIRQIPVLIKTMPSSHGHAEEVAGAVELRLAQMGFTIVRSTQELRKINIGDALGSVTFDPDETAIRKWEKSGGIIKGQTLAQWAEHHNIKSLPMWIRHMESKGRRYFSISDVPSEFRRHLRGFMQAVGESNSPEKPYILVLVDDNVESGASMREAASALSGTNPPVITVGAALINLSTSWGTGAPRRASVKS